MSLLSCAGCTSKDSEIAFLRQQLEGAQKSLLALTDARAYALRHPEKPAADPTMPAMAHQGPTTPARARALLFEPRETAEEIEESFVLQEGLGRARDNDPTGPPR